MGLQVCLALDTVFKPQHLLQKLLNRSGGIMPCPSLPDFKQGASVKAPTPINFEKEIENVQRQVGLGPKKLPDLTAGILRSCFMWLTPTGLDGVAEPGHSTHTRCLCSELRLGGLANCTGAFRVEGVQGFRK